MPPGAPQAPPDPAYPPPAGSDAAAGQAGPPGDQEWQGGQDRPGGQDQPGGWEPGGPQDLAAGPPAGAPAAPAAWEPDATPAQPPGTAQGGGEPAGEGGGRYGRGGYRGAHAAGAASPYGAGYGAGADDYGVDPGSGEAAASSVPGTGLRGAAPAGSRDELATAFQILVPIKSWLTDPGWRQGIRLLVIPYALLPLVFLALFGTSSNLSTPGWAYSLYVAPLWAIAFWLLIRPGQVGKLEAVTGAGIVAFVLIWMSVVTININNHLNPKGFADAIAVGYNEELAKALPILLAALLLLRWRQEKLDVRMWMFLGTIAGLTFGVREASLYTTLAIEHIATAAVNHSANLAVLGALSFAFRVFVDGFQHAIWAGVSAFFIGMAVNYPRRRIQLIVFGISIAAVLHALNDWLVSNIPSLWPWILLQALSLVLFLGYSMSATQIERNVRRTPLFRGDSMLMDKFTDSGSFWRSGRPPSA
jgi:RsiW-degrading membrane proteinase PrsW (M82 family)